MHIWHTCAFFQESFWFKESVIPPQVMGSSLNPLSMKKWDVSTNLLLTSLWTLVLCNLNPSLPEMTLKEWAMLFHTPRLYACCSYWKAWANSFACSCVCKCVLGGFSHVLLFVTLSTRLLCPWDFPAKNTGVGCHAFFQGILPTQGSNLCLP